MDFLFSGLFWGIVIMLLGLSVIVRVVFHIHIPIFQIIIGLIIIYIGLSIMLHSFGMKGVWHKEKAVFNEATVKDTAGKEYNSIFGKLNIDLSTVDISKGSVKKEINTVFGASFIKISSKMAVKIIANAVFGGVRLPDGGTAAFGTYVYKSPSYDEKKNSLVIELNTVFGGTEIEIAK